MAERILQESEEIAPGTPLTVFFQPLWVTPEKLKPEIVRVFSGTIFPVDAVTVSLFGEVAFSGKARGQTNLYTTLPGRNITAREFGDFVNSRLSLLSSFAAAGNVSVARLVAGDVTAENKAPDIGRIAQVALVVVGIAAVAWLVSSLARAAGR